MKRLAVLLLGLGTLTMGSGCFCWGGRCNPCGCNYGGAAGGAPAYGAPVPTGSLAAPQISMQAAYPVSDPSFTPAPTAAAVVPFSGYPTTALSRTESLPTY